MANYELIGNHGQSKKNILCPATWVKDQSLETAHITQIGASIIGESQTIITDPGLQKQVQLIFTSPPFPLNRKKKYGNEEGEEYKKWFSDFAPLLVNLLKRNGSIVIEMGNAWEPGLPVMSTLALESLLEFKKRAKLYLCQEFIWFNNAKLPTPAQWVTVERTRVKDSFTRFWWLSPSPNPKADNRRVLVEYSASMKSLLKRKRYNSGMRPSEHQIGEKSFLKDNGGAIPPNVLVSSNTLSNDAYRKYCRDNGYPVHPARMPQDLAKFFISLCTQKGDLVLDPFAGSNTTGAMAESLNRRWISIEADKQYASGGKGRFLTLLNTAPNDKRRILNSSTIR